MTGATDTYSYDAGDKLLSVAGPSGTKAFTYGTLGRTKTITSGGNTTTFNYDYEARVASITRTTGPTDTFAYNGMSARVKRTDANTGTRTYLRSGLMPASDVVSDSVINFTPGISERPGTAGQDRYYNDDALGSATDLTDLNGNILSTRKWDAFGNLTGTSTYFRGWNEGSGYEEDSGSGLKLLGYRYYDPSIARFLTPDPIGDGSNWYAYCGNNPVTFSDPLGLRAYNMNDDPADNHGMGSYNRIGKWGIGNVTIAGDTSGQAGWGWLHPHYWFSQRNLSKEAVIDMISKADGVTIWGHGASGRALIGNGDVLTTKDIKEIARRRRQSGLGKLEFISFDECMVCASPQYVNDWLEIAEEVRGFEDWTIDPNSGYRIGKKQTWRSPRPLGAPSTHYVPKRGSPGQEKNLPDFKSGQ